MGKQIKRMLTSSTLTIFISFSLLIFLAFVVLFSLRASSSPVSTTFTSFSQSNIAGEISKLDYLISNTKELLNNPNLDQQTIDSLIARLNNYEFEKSVLIKAADSNLVLSEIADFNYLYSKNSIALVDGSFNGYTYMLVFSSIISIITSFGINLVNNIVITYDRDCGMMNVLMSNSTDHKKIFKEKYLCSLIGSAIVFLVFTISYLVCIGAFSFDFKYIAINYSGKALILSTTSFILIIIFTMMFNLVVYTLISYSLSFMMKNTMLNFFLGVVVCLFVNALDTFAFNPFTVSTISIYYFYFAFKAILLIVSIVAFVIVNRKLSKIDF